jgi:hypothetical protein
VQQLYYCYSEDREWNWLWEWFWNPVMLPRVNRPWGKICFSFPELGRVETGWEEVVMSLWRQHYRILISQGDVKLKPDGKYFITKKICQRGDTSSVREPTCQVPILSGRSSAVLKPLLCAQPVLLCHAS